MGKVKITILLLAAILLGYATAYTGQVKTGKANENIFTDTRYGFTFRKNKAWEFKIPKENPDQPATCRFELRKQGVRTLTRRIIKRYRRGRLVRSEPLDMYTSQSIDGGLFVDTTDLDLFAFKKLLIEDNRDHKQKLAIAELAGFIRHNEYVAQGIVKLGNLGYGYRLSFEPPFAVSAAALAEKGEVYFTVYRGKVYLFYFSFKDAYFYYNCWREIERMLDTVTFPAEIKPDSTSAAPVKVCLSPGVSQDRDLHD